ncbi:MAG: hypothetical protein ACRDGA_13830 [Bacteroidota bacterium]
MTTPKKEFDSIQIKRDAQTKIYEAIIEMTPEEEIAYFRQSVDQSKFSTWWKSVSSRPEVSEKH